MGEQIKCGELTLAGHIRIEHQNLLYFISLTFLMAAAAHCSVPSPPRLGIAFAYYGVILASAELLERDLICGSTAPLVQDSSDDSEESHSPCHCCLFGPAAYRTMIISTVGEIACNLLSPPCQLLLTASQHSLQSVLLCVQLLMGQVSQCPLHCWQLALQTKVWDTGHELVARGKTGHCSLGKQFSF